MTLGSAPDTEKTAKTDFFLFLPDSIGTESQVPK